MLSTQAVEMKSLQAAERPADLATVRFQLLTVYSLHQSLRLVRTLLCHSGLPTHVYVISLRCSYHFKVFPKFIYHIPLALLPIYFINASLKPHRVLNFFNQRKSRPVRCDHLIQKNDENHAKNVVCDKIPDQRHQVCNLYQTIFSL
jgi:hypothetical protein